MNNKAVSIQQKIVSYVDKHKQLQGKSLEEIISIMLDDGEISVSDIKELQENSMFDTGIAITKSDSVSFKHAKQKESTNIFSDMTYF